MILAVPSRNWTTDTVKYRDVNNNYRTLQTISMTNSSEIGKYFDITGEFKEWLKADLGEDAAYDSHRGIMFMPGSNCPTNSYRLFYSANAPSSQMPAVVVEYTVDTSLAEGTYFIQNYACDRYLDVYYAGTASGTGTNICNFNGNNNQRWIVQRATNDYYYIRPAHAPNMYLYARDEYACRLTISNERMVWRIVRNLDGSYRIMPGDTERQAAESASGNIADGTIVQTWGFGNAPNQKWVFGKAEDLMASDQKIVTMVHSDFGAITNIPTEFTINIYYTTAARNRYVKKIVTQVRANQLPGNILGDRIEAAHLYNEINGDLDRSGTYLAESPLGSAVVYYIAENPRNKLYSAPLTIDSRFQIGNAAYGSPPPISINVYTIN